MQELQEILEDTIATNFWQNDFVKLGKTSTGHKLGRFHINISSQIKTLTWLHIQVLSRIDFAKNVLDILLENSCNLSC